MALTCVAVKRRNAKLGYAFANDFHSPTLTRHIIEAKLEHVKDAKVLSSKLSERQLFKGKSTNRVLALDLLA
jgi:hypothetical protein